MKDIRIIGGGPGDTAYILPAARQAAEQCDLIIGDGRMLRAFGLEVDEKCVFEMGPMMKRLEWLKEQPDSLKAGILVSGDPLIYSMFRLVRRTFPEAEVRIVPGIGSVQAFAARLGESMEESKIISAHGRNMTGEFLAAAVRQYPKLFILCDNERTPGWVAGQLMDMGLAAVDMSAGSRISYLDEKIISGAPEQLIGTEWPALSLVMIKSKSDDMEQPVPMNGKQGALNRLLRDDEFLRNQTPMTREEVRWIILGKLNLLPDSVLWDVGAGTGSVSVECARHCPMGKVIAVEKNPRALEVLYENQKQLASDNMEIIEGAAPEVLEGLERPTHVFVGGAGRALKDILKVLCKKGPGIQVVIASVTLETMIEACQLAETMEGLEKTEQLTIRIEKERSVGSYHLMEGGHPVTLLIARTCGGQDE
ncbi:precorrin-6y C5,15-methyltransferase (decarboxylating) subunit CbiE [Frisingicoccus caecimuris]|uniref:Precorrin-6Y C5,15-methyltransferase (Decarboxylating) n=1 Tax=Frisingicoccus caecimuris TaxID=1796636 RepID=A0A4R2LDU7_9FIRM|nr:precorrin-6y C5,15-methyltransferase (decarboxylating) subunit CbiE [Frisingicoccus caecimuris]MCR1917801.1 precorrin-6y C5,15-methyltransferase (decarboxylating) subunit CbiE [Frisingicoccus caecimuris]TCO86649.1 precorrin-6Y C5,15-methyltransferase (decarboxylating) [Frisingicoccus caecimuris]